VTEASRAEVSHDCRYGSCRNINLNT